MKKYVIVGSKWFDKINGNTYHKVRIIDVDSNEEIHESPVTYGYDEQWKQTAYDWLVDAKLATEKDRNNYKLNRKRFIYIDTGFGLKRDL